MPVLLSEKDVRAVLSMDDLITAMETALDRFSSGGVRQPLRNIIDVGGHGFYGVMPAYVSGPAALGTKLVSVYHGNAERGLPSHLATIVLQDPETGDCWQSSTAATLPKQERRRFRLRRPSTSRARTRGSWR